MSRFDKRNLSMMTDFYEMAMANGYFVNGGDTRVGSTFFIGAIPTRAAEGVRRRGLAGFYSPLRGALFFWVSKRKVW